MTPRLATHDDRDDLAAMHVQVWQETYAALLPAATVAKRDFANRQDIWERILRSGASVSYIPGVGFAQVGPQRDAEIAAEYPLELYMLNTLQASYGSGAGLSLLRHALAQHPDLPFSAEVLATNARALRFYEKAGGVVIRTTPEIADGVTIINLILGWMYGVQSSD